MTTVYAPQIAAAQRLISEKGGAVTLVSIDGQTQTDVKAVELPIKTVTTVPNRVLQPYDKRMLFSGLVQINQSTIINGKTYDVIGADTLQPDGEPIITTAFLAEH